MTNDEMQDALLALLERVQALEAVRDGYLITIAALIRTHPKFEAVHIELAGMLERQLAPDAALNQSPQHMRWVQAVVENFLRVEPGKSDETLRTLLRGFRDPT